MYTVEMFVLSQIYHVWFNLLVEKRLFVEIEDAKIIPTMCIFCEWARVRI